MIPAVKNVTVWALDLESEYIEVDAYKKVIVITNKYYASAIIDFLSSKKVEYTVQKKEYLKRRPYSHKTHISLQAFAYIL